MQDMQCADSCVVDSVVYMSAVNNTNKTWHVVICIVYSNNRQVRKTCLKALETLELPLGIVLHHSD